MSSWPDVSLSAHVVPSPCDGNVPGESSNIYHSGWLLETIWQRCLRIRDKLLKCGFVLHQLHPRTRVRFRYSDGIFFFFWRIRTDEIIRFLFFYSLPSFWKTRIVTFEKHTNSSHKRINGEKWDATMWPAGHQQELGVQKRHWNKKRESLKWNVKEPHPPFLKTYIHIQYALSKSFAVPTKFSRAHPQDLHSSVSPGQMDCG